MKQISKPDAKEGITLSKIAKGVSSFRLSMDEEKIILEPYAEVPLKELWLYDNKESLQALRTGLKDSSEERVIFKEDFSKYL